MATVAMIAALVAWFGLRHTPAWYDPPYVSAEDLPRVRASLPTSLQSFTDQLVEGSPFQFRLSARTVNEWIAARESIWPDTRGRLPEWLSNPIVAFEDGRVIGAGRFERDGWRAVVSMHLVIAPEEDELVVRLVKTGIGAFGAPTERIGRALKVWLDKLPEQGEKVPEYLRTTIEALRESTTTQLLSEGVRVVNEFVWPNGEREFRISEVAAGDGWLTLSVEPL